MYEQFVEKFLDDLVIFGQKSDCYNFYVRLKQVDDFSWLEERYNEILRTIESIDTSDPNYRKGLEKEIEAHGIPYDAYSALDYLTICFKLRWAKELIIEQKNRESHKNSII